MANSVGFKRAKLDGGGRTASFGPTTVLSEDDAHSHSVMSDKLRLSNSVGDSISSRSRQQRNREKAREGRNQKKECVKQLQARIRSLENERKLQIEQEELDAQANEQRSNIRKAILKNFMSGLTKAPSKEHNEKMWSCLVEPSFWLKQPVTLFRGFNRAEIQPGPCRISRGVPGLLAEASSLSVMIQNIGSDNDGWMATKYAQVMRPLRPCTPERSLECHSNINEQSSPQSVPAGAPFSFDPSSVLGSGCTSSGFEGTSLTEVTGQFDICEDHLIASGDTVMCSFTFRSRNAVFAGACSDMYLRGIARAEFSPSTNKLENVEFMYDSMGLMQQLVNASGRDSSVSPVVVPHNLEMALTPNAQEARVLTMASPPFPIIHINEAWTNMTHFNQLDVEGNSLTILNTPENITDDFLNSSNSSTARVNRGIRESDLSRVARGQCVYNASQFRDREGHIFAASVSSYPLAKDNGRIEHILHVFKKLEDVHQTPTHHEHMAGLQQQSSQSSISIPKKFPPENDEDTVKSEQKKVENEVSYSHTLTNFYDGGNGNDSNTPYISAGKSVVSAAATASSSSTTSSTSSPNQMIR